MRVVATGPVVASVEVSNGTTLSTTTGATAGAGSWLLPAASPGPVRLVVLNPELEDAQVVVRALRENGGEFNVTVPAESVIEVGLDASDAFLVDSDVPVVALLYEVGETADSIAIGAPIDDG